MICVEVIVFINKVGKLQPLYMFVENNKRRKYKIDRILEVKKYYSEVGGCGLLYKCMIDDRERHLFYERNRWFIENHEF